MYSYSVYASMNILPLNKSYTGYTEKLCSELRPMIHINLYCFFLQDNAVSKKKLQLVGVTAMFIASKYEELYPLCAADLIYVTDDNYTTSQMIQMEFQILQALDFRLSHPLASQFLNMALEVAKVELRTHVDISIIWKMPFSTVAGCLKGSELEYYKSLAAKLVKACLPCRNRSCVLSVT